MPIDAAVAIFWRSLIGTCALTAYVRVRGVSLRLKSRRQYALIVIGGAMMAFHWVTYFYALKLSSVAIGMLAITTYPAMTTLLEPLLLKKPFEKRHLILAGLVVVGVYFLVPQGNDNGNVLLGLGLGLASALVYALRNVLMKTQVEDIDGSVMMVYQSAVTMLLLVPLLFFIPAWPTPRAWPYLIALGLLVTGLGHTLLLNSFKYFSVSQASLISCVQPIYGICLGIIFFREIPGWSAVIGGALILSAVLVEGRYAVRNSPPLAPTPRERGKKSNKN